MAWGVPSFSLSGQPGLSQNWADGILGAREGARERQRVEAIDTARKTALEQSQNPDGSINYARMSDVLLGAGDLQGAQLAGRQAGDMADRDWRRERAGVEDAYRNRSLGLQERRLAQEGGGEGGGVFGTPIYGQDPETGQTALGVIGKDGTFRRIDTGGVRVTPGVSWQNTGTDLVPMDTKTGAQVGPAVPINNAQKAADTEAGKGAGEAAVTYRSMISKLPGLEKVVGDLNTLADQATYTMAGQALDAGMRQVGMQPREAAVARTKYISMVDNQILPLLRDTFGAQFTVEEGKALRATLGDPDKTPPEKKAVLSSFIEQKRRDVEALALQAMGAQGEPQGAAPAPAAPAPPPQSQIREGQRARNPQTGQTIEFRGGQWMPVQ